MKTPTAFIALCVLAFTASASASGLRGQLQQQSPPPTLGATDSFAERLEKLLKQHNPGPFPPMPFPVLLRSASRENSNAKKPPRCLPFSA